MRAAVTVAMQEPMFLVHVDPFWLKHDINMLIVSLVHGCMSPPSACSGPGHIIAAMSGKFQCCIMGLEYDLDVIICR